MDDRVPQDPAAVAKAITPDYALGGHTASLGLCWLPGGTLPGFPEGMAIGQQLRHAPCAHICRYCLISELRKRTALLFWRFETTRSSLSRLATHSRSG